MGRRRAAAILLAALAAALAAGPGALRAEEGAGDAAAAVADGERALAGGRHGDAEALFRRATAAEGAPAAAWRGLARTLRETGRVADALAAAAKAPGRETETLLLLGGLQADAGRAAEAEATLAEAVRGAAASARARAALGDLFRATGRRREALALYEDANRVWAEGAAEAPEELVAVVHARCAIFELDPKVERNLNDTFALLREPLRKGLPEAIVLQADIYTRHEETGKVANVLRPLLQRNPSHAGALVVEAQARVRRFESEEAALLARKALAVDRSHPGAIEVLVVPMLGDGQDEAALALVRRGLADRPAARNLLVLEALPALLAGDRDAWEAAVKRVLAIDPHYGHAFTLAARVLEDRRRFAEAAAEAARGTAVDPLDPEAWFARARNLLNLGEEKEAKEALARAEKADPWRDLFRENFLSVLEELDGYVAKSDGRFDLRIHPSEDPVLRPLYEAALRDSWEFLGKRYGSTPVLPLVVEVFRDAGSFSARTLGVPGFGAVGACFGRVITLDSPAALPAGAFSWRATLHHELAHVFHLQWTAGRVPRWYTEGLSVHEETVYRPHWIRNMDGALVSALANGTVKRLGEIDGEFRRDVQWAYYQSGLMLGWMEGAFGWPKVREMLDHYAKGRSNEDAVRAALGVEPEEFDRRFLEHCRGKVAGWSLRPRWSRKKREELQRRSEKDPADLDAHLDLAEALLQEDRGIDAGTALARAQGVAAADPRLLELRGWLALATLRNPGRGVDLLREALGKGRDHFHLRMRLAEAAEKDGRVEEAVEHLRRAKAHFPRAAGDGSPRRRLARILQGTGDAAGATRELREEVDLSEGDVELRFLLAANAATAGDDAEAVRLLLEIVDILPIPARVGEPFPAADVHARLGRSLARLDRHADAADALRRAVAVGRGFAPRAAPRVLAEWLVEFARSAAAAGRRVEARGALQDARRTDPENPDAADLLRSLEER